MRWLDRYTKQDAQEVVDMVAAALAEKLAQNGQQAPIIVIGRIDIRINYASGGGAKVEVRG